MKSAARQQARLVDREVRHHRHAVVLDLAEAQQPFLARVVIDERGEHVVPVLRDARRTMLGQVRQERAALLRVAARQHRTLRVEPFDAGQAVHRLAVAVPAGGVGPSEAVHQLLRERQLEVAGGDLDVQQDDVDAVEEVQVDMDDLQGDRRVAGPRHDAHRRDVAAPEHAHRRAGGRVAAAALGAALAVQEALHIRQEADELVVVALLKAAGAAVVLVDVLAPGRRVAHVAQQLPRRAASHIVVGHAGRYQPERPEQHLLQMPDGHRGPALGLRRNARVEQHAASVGSRSASVQPGVARG